MMKLQWIKRWLWLAGATLVAASALVVAAGLLLPYDTAAMAPPSGPAQPANVAESRAVLPPLADLQAMASVDLRRPLAAAAGASPTAPAAEAASADVSSLPMRLAGTVVEPGKCYAILVASDGKVELKVVGDIVFGAEILEIHEQSITVRWHGQAVVLSIPKAG